MLVNALHAALEDAEIAFDRVRVLLAIVKADILAAAVVDRAVTRELRTNLGVEFALVRHELAFAAGVLAQDQPDGFGVGVIDVERAGLAAAFHQRHDGALAGRAAPAALGERTIPTLRRRLRLFLVAEVGLVRPPPPCPRHQGRQDRPPRPPSPRGCGAPETKPTCRSDRACGGVGARWCLSPPQPSGARPGTTCAAGCASARRWCRSWP